jgi:hypothetical protein
MSAHQVTLEILDTDQHTGEDTRAELARSLEAEVACQTRPQPPRGGQGA